MEYCITTLKERPDLARAVEGLYSNAWPKFVSGEKVMSSYWGFINEHFWDHQILLINRETVLAVVNSAAFHQGKDNDEVSSEGIYWGLNKIAHDFYNKKRPDTLMALQVIVNPQFKKKGLSYHCVKELKCLAKCKGYDNVYIPLRPSCKHLYPLMPIEEYVVFIDEMNKHYDPWIRVNVMLGGEVIKPCKGITIIDTIEQWETWTGLSFPFDGSYVVSEAMVPIEVDVLNNKVSYYQENVWIRHKIMQ